MRSAMRAGWLYPGGISVIPWPRRMFFVRCEAAARNTSGADECDRKILLAGRSSGADEVRVVDGEVAERRFAALYRRGDRLVGVLAMNRPRVLNTYRALVERGATWAEALAA